MPNRNVVATETNCCSSRFDKVIRSVKAWMNDDRSQLASLPMGNVSIPVTKLEYPRVQVIDYNVFSLLRYFKM